MQLPPPGEVHTLFDGRRVMSRPKVRSMGKMEALVLPPSGELGDRIETWGEAYITNGPGKCRIEGCGCKMNHFASRNKIVGQGLRHLAQYPYTFGAGNATANPFESNQTARSRIMVGTGSGATGDTTTSLAAMVNTNPTSTAVVISNPSSGLYRFSFTATWNSGVITGATVTEIGIFGALSVTLGSTGRTDLAMFARLSVTDGEFSSFVINTAAPLAIEYRVNYAFV